MSKVLVIDDQPELRLLFQRVLEAQGHAVTPAEHGQAGLVSVDALTPDLILLDMAMPIMDGLTFLRALRAKPHCQNIPVLILSGLMSSDQIQAAKNLGAADPLVKAEFTMKQLRSRVAQLLSQPGTEMPSTALAGACGAATA
jgi:CheY-like chemotaxis protein